MFCGSVNTWSKQGTLPGAEMVTSSVTGQDPVACPRAGLLGVRAGDCSFKLQFEAG